MAFYIAIGAASAELLTLLTLAFSSFVSARQRAPVPHLKDDHEKKRSMSFGIAGRFSE